MRVGKNKKVLLTVWVVLTFILSFLPIGVRPAFAEEVNGEEQQLVQQIEPQVNITWTNLPDDVSIPGSTLKILTSDVLIDSVNFDGGTTKVTFNPVDKFNSEGIEIPYRIEQDPISDFETTIKGFIVENTYVKVLEHVKDTSAEVTPPVEEAPPEEEAPPVEEEPIEEAPPAEEDPPTEEAPPAEEDPPVVVTPPVEEAPPTEEDPPVVVTLPVEQTPLVEEAPMVEEAPPVDEAPPAEEAPPVKEDSPAEEVHPIEENPPVVVVPPVEEAPSTPEIPPAVENPVIEDTPAIEEVPPVEVPPVEEVMEIPTIEAPLEVKGPAENVNETGTDGVIALSGPVPINGVYTPDPGFDMVATDHSSINNNTLVKYIWVEDGRIFMAISALANIEITNGVPAGEPVGVPDVTINGVYPTGRTPYPDTAKVGIGPSITIEGTVYPPHRNQAFWTVIYFDNLPPLFDSGNVVHVNTDRGGGHEVVGETFNVVRKYYTFVVNKKWRVNRPPTLPSVTFQILLGGTTNITYSPNPLTGTVDGTAEGIGAGQYQGETASWQYTWKNVPETNAYGDEYTYTVSEVALTGYTPVGPGSPIISGDGLTFTYEFTNTYINDNVDIEAHKVWQNGPKPDVYFQLWQKIGTTESVVPGRPHRLITSTVLTAYWDDLPEYQGTTRIVYFIKEVNALEVEITPEHYTKTYSEDRLTITNTFVPPTGSVDAAKSWSGGPTPRPTVWFKLYRQIGTGTPEMVPLDQIPGEDDIKRLDDGTTQISWTGIALRDNSGIPYSFSVKELNEAGANVPPANYIMSEVGLTVTNTYSPPTTTVNAQKIWVGGPTPRPIVWFKLYRQIGTDGTPEMVPFDQIPGENDIKELDDGTTEVSWTDIAQMDNLGRPYIFSVREVDAVGSPFTPAYYVKSESGLTVTNTYTLSTVVISKEVAGNMGDRNKEFTFTASLAGGAQFPDIGTGYMINPENHSEATFTLKDGQSVNLIVPVGAALTIVESNNAGYIVSVKVNEVPETYPGLTVTVPTTGTTMEFTNTKTVIIETGVLVDSLPYILILMMVATGGIGGIIWKRKHTNYD